jgi:integrase
VKNNVSTNHEKPIKDSTDLKSTKSFDLGGGKQEKWKKILKDISQTIEPSTSPMDGEDMVSLAYDVKKINRLNFPSNLNPQQTSFTEVGLHAIIRQRLKESTVEKHLRYARFMETHTIPVDFRNPTFQNFISHMDYREQIEHATPNALIHEWKAMQTFLKAYGIPFGPGTEWNYHPPSAQRSRARILLLPDVVNRFFTYEFSKDPYETALYQYLFFHSYMIGWRVPSEIITMKTTDIRIDDPIPHIIITEPKKQSNTRPLFDVEAAILTSKVHKSIKNWVDHWRPKVENQYSGDSLYLWPSGKPVTIRTLGHLLSIQGKKIHKEFRPYDMRHWCAVARLIKTKVETGTYDVFQIQRWLGHEEITTTNTYIGQAVSYYHILPVDWISLALKPRQKYAETAGQRDKEKTNRTPFSGLLTEFPPREDHGPVAI